MGVLFEVDGFGPIWILHPSKPGEIAQRIHDYQGFAYVDGGYLLEAERSGRFTCNYVELLDGRAALFAPGQDNSDYVRATVSDLFIHEREFSALRNQQLSEAEPTPKSGDWEPSPKGRNTALCIIAAVSQWLEWT